MKFVELREVAEFIRGITYKPDELVENFSENSVVCMRTANVQKTLDESNLLSVPAELIKNDQKYLLEGDILVSTANSWNLVGKCSWVHNLGYKATAGGFIAILRAKTEFINSRYLYHWFNSESIQIQARNCGRQTTNISNMDIDRCLSINIFLPPLEEQRRIASILDKADAIRQKRQQAIVKLDELLQAKFIDMFGDPVSNPKGWKFKSLKEFGTFKNGLNYGKGESGVTRKYIGVGNFKNFSKLDDIDSLGSIELNQEPSQDYFLKDGDLLFVRSNGNKELVGRCIAVYPRNELVTYSGFCIRYRIEKEGLTPEFISHLFKSESFRSSILKAGQGANIQNINQQSLGELKIPVPSEDLLAKWSSILHQVEKQKTLYSKELEHSLFTSLQQKSFNGTL
ncbi:Type-1 restriction enzyme EcoKI specificity protein [Acinetobacter junii]|uniref:restriction endonuclease subunit S n=1 Tax=Acinetobacter junii TaxID=40215 RepID=UPI00195BCD94|nr:restriction endonuclease subunit S [Acinetobacter junii]VTX88648.1 Type-1 restriction enzyme EcoKI specificity protein [Acinetobacter junii]